MFKDLIKVPNWNEILKCDKPVIGINGFCLHAKCLGYKYVVVKEKIYKVINDGNEVTPFLTDGNNIYIKNIKVE
jgi:hypothetical protein